MKRERPIDRKLKREATRLRRRLLSSPSPGPNPQNVTLYELWLGELSALAGSVSPASASGLP